MSLVLQTIAAALEQPGRVPCADWSESNLSIDSELEGGRYRLRRTPYHREVLESFGDASIQTITLKWSTQVGKTTLMLAFAGYSVDQDPGSMLWVLPTEELARDFSKERIEPMVTRTKPVKRHFKMALGSTRGKMKISAYYFDRMRINMAWANSASSVSSRPCRRVFFDETNKFPGFSGREGSPLKLGEERTKNFWNKKSVRASTPTVRTGVISVEYLKGDQRTYRVPCPHCGAYQRLVTGQLKWPEWHPSPQEVKLDRLAWYECIACKGQITDRHKPQMLDRGVWCPEGCDVDADGCVVGDIPKTDHRSYHLCALYSPWVAFSDYAAEFLDSQGDPAKMMNFTNSWEAEDFEETDERVELADVLRLRISYGREIIPDGVRMITSGTDVQKDSIYYAVRGWGFDDESWSIEHDHIEGKDDLDQFGNRVMMRTWRTGDGRTLAISPGCIDGKYRTQEVVKFAANPRFQGRLRVTMGANKNIGGCFYPSKITRHPRTGELLKNSYQIWHIDTQQLKDWLHGMRSVSDLKPDPTWHIPENADTDYMNQLAAEHKIKLRNVRGEDRFVWVVKQGHQANHYLDCEVYAAAGVWMNGLHLLWRPIVGGATGQQRRVVKQGIRGRDGGSFVARR